MTQVIIRKLNVQESVTVIKMATQIHLDACDSVNRVLTSDMTPEGKLAAIEIFMTIRSGRLDEIHNLLGVVSI